MSGTPTEAEIRTQWRAAVDILEDIRGLADATLAGPGGKFDTLLQALEGEYTPASLANFVQTARSAMSNMVSPSMAAAAFQPILREYAAILAASGTTGVGFGSGYTDDRALFRSLYEYFANNGTPITVQSRNLVYGSASAGGSNTGNGALARLTEDENGYSLEACHVEKKIFRCRSDANTGTEKHAEAFEVLGEMSSYDNLLRNTFGSGQSARTALISKHAGSGRGGSLLNNSSFSQYNSANSPTKFNNWTEVAGGSDITQDTTNFYRSHPGASTDASLRITTTGTVTLKQSLTASRVRQLDPNVPYFLRVMYNRQIGSCDGTFRIKMGDTSSADITLSAQTGWNELIVATDQGCWPRNFDVEDFGIEIELENPTSGYLLVDDVIFAPWDQVDGTYWCLRGNATSHTPWLVDDTLEVSDTQASFVGVLQYWLWVAGYGYLPSTTGSPTITDP